MTIIRKGPSGPPEDVATGGVDSVFTRVGDIVADDGDYNSDQVTNESNVAGPTVSAALDNAAASGPAAQVTSVHTRQGAVVSDDGDYNSTQVTNDSNVPGANVSAALDNAAASGPAGAVSSVFGRLGAVAAQNNDYGSTAITNQSIVSGATVTVALNVLNTAIGAISAGRVLLGFELYDTPVGNPDIPGGEVNISADVPAGTTLIECWLNGGGGAGGAALQANRSSGREIAGGGGGAGGFLHFVYENTNWNQLGIVVGRGGIPSLTNVTQSSAQTANRAGQTIVVLPSFPTASVFAERGYQGYNTGPNPGSYSGGGGHNGGSFPNPAIDGITPIEASRGEYGWNAQWEVTDDATPFPCLAGRGGASKFYSGGNRYNWDPDEWSDTTGWQESPAAGLRGSGGAGAWLGDTTNTTLTGDQLGQQGFDGFILIAFYGNAP